MINPLKLFSIDTLLPKFLESKNEINRSIQFIALSVFTLVILVSFTIRHLRRRVKKNRDFLPKPAELKTNNLANPILTSSKEKKYEQAKNGSTDINQKNTEIANKVGGEPKSKDSDSKGLEDQEDKTNKDVQPKSKENDSKDLGQEDKELTNKDGEPKSENKDSKDLGQEDKELTNKDGEPKSENKDSKDLEDQKDRDITSIDGEPKSKYSDSKGLEDQEDKKIANNNGGEPKSKKNEKKPLNPFQQQLFDELKQRNGNYGLASDTKNNQINQSKQDSRSEQNEKKKESANSESKTKQDEEGADSLKDQKKDEKIETNSFQKDSKQNGNELGNKHYIPDSFELRQQLEILRSKQQVKQGSSQPEQNFKEIDPKDTTEQKLKKDEDQELKGVLESQVSNADKLQVELEKKVKRKLEDLESYIQRAENDLLLINGFRDFSFYDHGDNSVRRERLHSELKKAREVLERAKEGPLDNTTKYECNNALKSLQAAFTNVLALLLIPENAPEAINVEINQPSNERRNNLDEEIKQSHERIKELKQKIAKNEIEQAKLVDVNQFFIDLEKNTQCLTVESFSFDRDLCRFKDIQCPKSTCVLKKTIKKDGKEKDQFLHANYVDLGGYRYIATQYPLDLDLFWEAVSEQGNLIIDLSNEDDMLRDPLLRKYAPNEPNFSKPKHFEVDHQTLNQPNGVSIPSYQYSISNETLKEKKIVNRYHLNTWKDGEGWDDKKLDQLEELVDIVNANAWRVESDPKAKSVSPFIHCRAGVGRTGTFIVCAYIKRLIEMGEIQTADHLKKHVEEGVMAVRKQRGINKAKVRPIQSKDQLNTIWNFAIHVLEKKLVS